MLTCIARSKQPGDDSLSQAAEIDSSTTTGTKQTQAMKSLTSQVIKVFEIFLGGLCLVLMRVAFFF